MVMRGIGRALAGMARLLRRGTPVAHDPAAGRVGKPGDRHWLVLGPTAKGMTEIPTERKR